MVLANQGFDITDDLVLCGASLGVPPFTKGKDQLSVRHPGKQATERLNILTTFPITIHDYTSLGKQHNGTRCVAILNESI